MKKTVIVFITIVLAIICAGCAEPKETLPKGVLERNGAEWYIVQIPSGKNVDDYFERTGESGFVHMTYFGGTERRLSSASFTQVEEGGWIAYSADLFMYIPCELSVEEAQSACNALILNCENYMSLEQAKQYIPFIM